MRAGVIASIGELIDAGADATKMRVYANGLTIATELDREGTAGPIYPAGTIALDLTIRRALVAARGREVKHTGVSEVVRDTGVAHGFSFGEASERILKGIAEPVLVFELVLGPGVTR